MDLGFLPNGGTAAEDATLEPTRFKFKHQGSPLDVQIPSTRTQGYEGALSSDPHALQRQFVTTDSPSAASPTNPTHFHPQPLHQRARGIFGPRFTSPQREAALRLARKSQHQSGQNVAHTATSGTYSVLAMEEHTTSHTTSRIESETTAAGPGCRLQRSKSKTLHQRLDNDIAAVDGLTSRLATDDFRVHQRTPSLKLLQNDHVISSPFRSASVASSIFTRQDEDISAIMMRGANDLRNAKVENEEQRREIAFLHDQLEVAKNEKADVLKRITAVKEAAKRTLDTSSQNLKDMEVTLKELKSQSERSFEIVAHARESLSNVQELRKTASEAMHNIQPLLDENRNYSQAVQTKAVVQELQLECSSTQQVADLLRDRLQSLGADFIDAKNRVTELEDAQVADRKALRDATSNLSSASVQVGKLTESLRKQGDQLYEALSSAADAEAKFSVSSQEIMRSRHLISEKDEELETLHSVEEENRKLLLQLDECRSSLSALAGIQDELSTANEVLHGRGSEICILQASVAARDATIMTMQEKLREAEKRWQEEHTSVLRLKGDLKTCEVREHGALMRIESLVSDKDQLSEKTRELETRLEEVRRDAGDRTEKLHQMNARCQVLEERFEEQAVTLRITKECNGDLQERLLAAEANHATNLESSAGKFTCEIAVLNEQKANLQARADDLQAQMTRKDDETRSLTAELEAKLKNQEIEYVSRCTVEQQRTTKAEDDLRKTQAHICVLEEKLSTASARVVELQQELKFTNSSSFNRQEEIDALKSHIRLLETRAEQLSQRAKTIDVRYGAGDLADVEKAFIQSLLQTSQAMHEQELIAKGNELRRRDNTIKELRAKVQLVESTLAKHVRTQVHGQPPPSGHSPHTGPQQSKIQPDAGVGHQSLIDPTYWMSSNHSSSPMTTALAVPEVGSPSKEVAAPQTRQPTETTVSRSPHQLLTGPKVTKVAGSAGKAAAKESGNLAADPCTPGKPLDVSGPATKPQFSRLATVCSDENFTLEDDPIQPTTPTAGLGKRGQMSSVANEATASRQPKRSKTSVPRKSAESKVPTLAENTGTKSRPRKKR